MKKTPQTKTKRGKYRKQGYVKINDREIVGLKRRPDGRFYAADSPTKTFGKEPQTALLRFTQWLATQKGETVKLASERGKLIDRPEYVYWDEAGYREVVEVIPYAEVVDVLHNIPAAEFWQVVKERILADPYEAAKRTGLPLDRLESLPKPKKPQKLPLSEIGQLYKAKSMTPNEQSRSTLAWGEFQNAVSPAATIEDIDEAAIEAYGAFLASRKLSQKTIRNRLLKIGTILNHAKPRRKDHAQAIESVKSDLYLLIERPKEPDPDPKPIKPKHFAALLKAADTKWEAMLLLALNAALHPKELGEVLAKEIDLEDQTFITKRTKTGVRRCAKLWNRTVSAIRAYQEENPHDGPFLFANAYGGMYNAHSVIDGWKRLVKNSKLPKSLGFDSIRDGARTQMSGDGARVVMGHSIGVDDKYNLRMPDSPEVVAACEAIEAHYFTTDETQEQ